MDNFFVSSRCAHRSIFSSRAGILDVRSVVQVAHNYDADLQQAALDLRKYRQKYMDSNIGNDQNPGSPTIITAGTSSAITSGGISLRADYATGPGVTNESVNGRPSDPDLSDDQDLSQFGIHVEEEEEEVLAGPEQEMEEPEPEPDEAAAEEQQRENEGRKKKSAKRGKSTKTSSRKGAKTRSNAH